MWRYFELLSFRVSTAQLGEMRHAVERGEKNPRDFKVELASELVERFHGARAAQSAIDFWNESVRGGAVPADLPLKEVVADISGLAIAAVLKAAGLTSSTSEAIRKIGERAVRIDGVVIEDRTLVLAVGVEYLLQVGKRSFCRVRLISTAS
jgi:tyrosyl-tRNA synthetase